MSNKLIGFLISGICRYVFVPLPSMIVANETVTWKEKQRQEQRKREMPPRARMPQVSWRVIY